MLAAVIPDIRRGWGSSVITHFDEAFGGQRAFKISCSVGRPPPRLFELWQTFSILKNCWMQRFYPRSCPRSFMCGQNSSLMRLPRRQTRCRLRCPLHSCCTLDMVFKNPNQIRTVQWSFCLPVNSSLRQRASGLCMTCSASMLLPLPAFQTSLTTCQI